MALKRNKYFWIWIWIFLLWRCVGWACNLFLRWCPPLIMWAGPLILSSTATGDVWIIPSFGIWGYVLHVEHISCVITNCHQHQWVSPSFSIALTAPSRPAKCQPLRILRNHYAFWVSNTPIRKPVQNVGKLRILRNFGAIRPIPRNSNYPG